MYIAAAAATATVGTASLLFYRRRRRRQCAAAAAAGDAAAAQQAADAKGSSANGCADAPAEVTTLAALNKLSGAARFYATAPPVAVVRVTQQGEALAAISAGLCALKGLRELDLRGNAIEAVPASIGNLTALTRRARLLLWLERSAMPPWCLQIAVLAAAVSPLLQALARPPPGSQPTRNRLPPRRSHPLLTAGCAWPATASQRCQRRLASCRSVPLLAAV